MQGAVVSLTLGRLQRRWMQRICNSAFAIEDALLLQISPKHLNADMIHR